MTSTRSGRLFAAVAALAICAAGPQDGSTAQPRAKSAGGIGVPAAIMLAESTIIPSAYVNGAVSGSLKPECNTKSAATASAMAVRLHIKNRLLRHLLDGKACESCLDITHAVQRCDGQGKNCIDDDLGASPVVLPSAKAPGLGQSSGVYATRLDIGLTKDVWKQPSGTQAASILLKIMLDDPDMAFMRKPNADATDSTYAVRQGVDPDDTSNNNLFDCRQPIVTVGYRSSVQFRIKNPAKATAIGSINIGVTVIDRSDNDGFVLPIILDPKVPNNG